MLDYIKRGINRIERRGNNWMGKMKEYKDIL